MEAEPRTKLEVLGYVNKKPFFHGHYGYVILHSEDNWILFDTLTNTTLAYVTLASSDLYPFGRRLWSVVAPVCKKEVGTLMELSLSVCNETQYMCSDGQCIALEDRCDAKDDCIDETDEDNCAVLEIPEGYRKFKPPKNSENSSLPLQPYLQVELLRFLNIEDVQSTINVEFQVQLKWTDSRLRFKNLRDNLLANPLSEEEVEAIWRPSVQFPNIKDGKLTMIKEGLYAQKVASPLPANIDAVEMGKSVHVCMKE